MEITLTVTRENIASNDPVDCKGCMLYHAACEAGLTAIDVDFERLLFTHEEKVYMAEMTEDLALWQKEMCYNKTGDGGYKDLYEFDSYDDDDLVKPNPFWREETPEVVVKVELTNSYRVWDYPFDKEIYYEAKIKEVNFLQNA